MPKTFDQDTKDCVVRLIEDRVLAENLFLQKACQVVAPRLDVSWHTARQWVQHSRREGGFITSRGYRQSNSRGVSARALRDVVVIERVKQIHRDNY